MAEFLGLFFLSEFVDEKVVVGGDGQCDSPEFTATNLCYFVMELTSGTS